MCCAISCADYGMVEFLTRTGMDISTPCCCCYAEQVVSSFPLLFLGLTSLLNLNDKAYETVVESKVLENIKNIVKDFAGNFTGTARSPRDSHMRSNCCGRRVPPTDCGARKSKIACHETETSQIITVLDIIISSFNKYSKQFILELLTFFLDFFDFNLYIPLSVSDELSISDFLVRNQEVEDRLFYLFQAGASPEFIRHYAKHFRHRITMCDISNPSKEYYSIHHCEALVFERNKDFLEIDFEGEYAEIKSKPDYGLIWDADVMRECVCNERMDAHVSLIPVSSEHLAIKLSQLEGFLEWYRRVTSSPFTLKNECRTLIRKSLIEASNHRSILKKIELLHLPKQLKKYLIYE